MTALNDQLRLEILATTSGNAITNHSAQSGATTGWTVDAASPPTTISAASGLAFGYGGKAIKIATPLPLPYGTIRSEPFTIVGNQYANAAVTIRSGNANTNYQFALAIRFYNSSNAVIGSASFSSNAIAIPNSADTTFTLDTKTNGSLKAPSGTTYGRVEVQTGPGNGPAPTVAFLTYLWDVMVVVGTTAASVVGPVFSDVPETWQNLLPASSSHIINRGGDVDGVTDNLDVGTLTSVLHDPAVTPENNDRVRPGRPIRLVRASDGAPIFTGRISNAATAWRTDQPVVTISASDATADLENYAQPVGKSGRFKQRIDAAMLDVPITYSVTDTDSNTTSATISTDESGTALSQVKLVRESLRGLYYVAKNNTVKFFANNSYPSQTPTVVLSDNYADMGAIFYLANGIVTNFDSKNLVNTLLVTKANLSEDNGSKTYGPYVNQDSVDEWGTVTATLTVNDGTPSTLAAAYLAVYDEPTTFVDSVTYNATADISTAVARELYEAATVKFAPALVNTTYRVIGIQHNITADKWLVTLNFRPMESTSSITVTNPPAGANTGPADTVPFTRETQTGTATGTVGAGDFTQDVNVTFPTPYESAPTVVVGLKVSTTTHVYGAWLVSASTTGCVIRLSRYEGSATTGSVSPSATWVAIAT